MHPEHDSVEYSKYSNLLQSVPMKYLVPPALVPSQDFDAPSVSFRERGSTPMVYHGSPHGISCRTFGYNALRV